MSTLQTLKTYINQRLAVAVEEISALLETTISNYEEEINRQRRLLEDERSEFLINKAGTQEAMRFRVIIEHDIKKITFQNGLPSTLEDLIKVFKQAFSITTEIGLLYKDADFDDFFTLTSTGDLKDKDTLKVVHLPAPSGITRPAAPQQRTPADFDNSLTITSTCSLKDKDIVKVEHVPLSPGILMATAPQERNPDTSDTSSVDDRLSVDSQDAVIPSSPATGRQSLWPAIFPIPTFSYNTEMALRQGNEKFLKDGILLTSPSVKSDILERLAEAMFSYTAYPNDPQRTVVAQALIEKHPCLREPGSYNGCYGWQQSLKYKCANYRSKLKAHGNPELLINSLKHKQEGERQPAKNIKKPRKAEVNFLPPHPAGETDESLENVRLELIAVSRTKDNGQMINDMMSRTYSYRRREVVGQSMTVAEFRERWPALFEPVQINEEFQRCNTVPLEQTFISQLDRHTPKLLELFSSKGGAVGQRMKSVLIELIKDPHASLVKKRDVTLRCLIEYLGESVQELVSDYYRTAEDEVHQDLKTHSMRIYVCHQPDAVGIIIDGTPVLTGLDNMSKACCLLLGLTYALNLDYPPKLAKTFEVFQRLFVGLDMLQPKPTSKYINLKNKLFT
ncbi:uncharacterized protein LOC125902801 isoform X1 [Epinephelus fuscoguttatus]|uniref:uncharacterized protein LOC125902801 isoform X1 n=2 Tax=Epinephelus fuscoguttatus TaxID=293821 RepID=UPI0020D01659|nr:uncharacterized protein LOC125902801 isoform X1 [Epinephelus fuscoguttatus]